MVQLGCDSLGAGDTGQIEIGHAYGGSVLFVIVFVDEMSFVQAVDDGARND